MSNIDGAAGIIPVTHTQEAQILTPYLDEAIRITELDGTLHLTAMDDAGFSVRFMVKGENGAFMKGVRGGVDDAPAYAFALEYGTLTIRWEPSETRSGLVGGGRKKGFWTYRYVYDPGVPQNIVDVENIEIRAYDPERYTLEGGGEEGYVDLGFEVTIITKASSPDDLFPARDALRMDPGKLPGSEEGMAFGAAPPCGPDKNRRSLPGHGRTRDEGDAAVCEHGAWVPKGGVSVAAQSVEHDYGTLTINGDGTFAFVPKWEHPGLAALAGGENKSITIPYTMTENGKYVTSSLVIQFTVNNGASDAESITLSMSGGPGADSGARVLLMDPDTAIDTM